MTSSASWIRTPPRPGAYEPSREKRMQATSYYFSNPDGHLLEFWSANPT
jgi:hypothetical protein